MLYVMADQEKKDETVSGKVTKATKRKLEEISRASDFQPSISKLVELAVAEYIERHHPQSSAVKKK